MMLKLFNGFVNTLFAFTQSSYRHFIHPAPLRMWILISIRFLSGPFMDGAELTWIIDIGLHCTSFQANFNHTNFCVCASRLEHQQHFSTELDSVHRVLHHFLLYYLMKKLQKNCVKFPSLFFLARVFSLFCLCVDVFSPNYPLLYVHEMLAIIFFLFFFSFSLNVRKKREQPNQIKMVGTIKKIVGFSFVEQQK